MEKRTFQLRLFHDDEMITLELFPANVPRALSEAVRIPKTKVFFDASYRAQIVSSRTRDIRNLDVLLNGYSVNHNFFPETGNINFFDNAYREKIFMESFGLAQIRLRFRTSYGVQDLVSERFAIMVHPGTENETVDQMGQYVAWHNRTLLYGTQNDWRSSELSQESLACSLEDKVRFLKGMIPVLENSWQVVRTHPLQGTSANSGGLSSLTGNKMIRHLAAHPELLEKSASGSGIQIGNRHYVFDSSGFSRTGQTTDIYENRVVLQFLRLVCEDIGRMLPKLDQARKSLPQKVDSRETYISSSSFLYNSKALVMDSILKDLESLQVLYENLKEAYMQAIPASEIVMNKMPRATPAFQSVAAYRQIYEHIHMWYRLKDVHVDDMRFIKTFLQITSLYEVYVLTKIQSFFLYQGYELVSAGKKIYEMEKESMYENTNINNCFVYEKGEYVVTLYYQPVIYDAQRQEGKGGIELYRSTSLSYPKGWQEPSRGSFYTPDFVLRLSLKGSQKHAYILGDAKYTTLKNTQDYKVIPLVYKYLYSIACVHPEDEISGLYIFHGKHNDDSEIDHMISPVHDLSANPHGIFPQTEIITLCESAKDVEQEQMLHLGLLIDSQWIHLRKRIGDPMDH